jgi:GNAT superfamily N-acetyltransferase
MDGAPEPPSQRGVVIDVAIPDHFPSIAGLAGEIWRHDYPAIISQAQIEFMLARMYDVAVMQHELDTGVVYERLLVDSKLRGFAAHGPAATPDEWKLHKLYVLPGFQRRGAGTLLLGHVERLARQRGSTALVLTVNKRNTRAMAVYARNGFTVRESLVVDIGGGFVMDDYLMAKALER